MLKIHNWKEADSVESGRAWKMKEERPASKHWILRRNWKEEKEVPQIRIFQVYFFEG